MDLALLTADVFELDQQLIKPSEPEWGALAGIPIPRDTSLSATATAALLGYQLPNVRELLERYRHEVDTGTL